MTWDERKKSRKFFPLSRVKFYANVILKCRQFFYLESEIFFVSSQILRKPYSQMSAISFYLQSEIFSFVSSQFLRKRYSQMSAIFFISSRKLFPLSRVKFYANAILKCRQFFLSQVGIFSFVSSQILRKCYSQTLAIFLSWVRNFFLRLDLRWRKTFPTWDKKIADIWE